MTRSLSDVVAMVFGPSSCPGHGFHRVAQAGGVAGLVMLP